MTKAQYLDAKAPSRIAQQGHGRKGTQTQAVLPQVSTLLTAPLWRSVRTAVQQVPAIYSQPEAPRSCPCLRTPSHLTLEDVSRHEEGRKYWKLHVQDFNPTLTFLSYLLDRLPNCSSGDSNMQPFPLHSHIETFNT